MRTYIKKFRLKILLLGFIGLFSKIICADPICCEANCEKPNEWVETITAAGFTTNSKTKGSDNDIDSYSDSKYRLDQQRGKI